MPLPFIAPSFAVSPPRQRLKRVGGFTLVELLTVVAIIGILVLILLSVIGGVRERAKATKCVSNLRQTGIAIQTYVSDNQGLLPPVGHLSISPYFNADPRNFQHALAPYLSVIKTSSWSNAVGERSYAPVLDCPGHKGDPGAACYSIRENVTTADGETFIPWGRVFQVGNQFLQTRQPTKHSLVPQDAIALIDRNHSATEPNHSGFQNALHFDWSVSRVTTAN